MMKIKHQGTDEVNNELKSLKCKKKTKISFLFR